MPYKKEKFSIRARVASFRHAFRGLLHVLRKEHNFQIQLGASIVAIIMGVIFQISRTHWLVIILCIGFVITAEIMNTAIEKLVDMISTQRNEKAGIIKDIAAGGVLVAAIMALVAGIIVFLSYL
jgi:diacylglycerol kinase (ATP)